VYHCFKAKQEIANLTKLHYVTLSYVGATFFNSLSLQKCSQENDHFKANNVHWSSNVINEEKK
jgi:hypothetical protein